MNPCKKFAMIMAKQKGMTYAEATKKFARGYTKNSVYVNKTGILEGHCVHCSRASALAL